MNGKSLYFFLLFFSFVAHSQDYTKVDLIVKDYQNFNNLNELVFKLNTDFNNDLDKTRAIFFWISTNISYDVQFAKKINDESLNAFSYKTQKEKEQKEKKFISELAIKSFNSKNAVCFGYAALFFELSNKLGIECKLVQGDLKSSVSQINNKIELNHAWNVIKIQNEWKFVDCTISAGYISSKTNQFIFKFNDSFFLTEPELFFLNHFPEEKKWLLINKTEEDYITLPVYFPDYFKSNLKVKSPVSGILSNANNVNILFDNINFEDDIVKCFFNKSNEFVYLEYNKSINGYEIPLKEKQDDYLIIYINKTPIVLYKIAK